jgi:glycosyltransferase involved in cell wall biosynthesis
VRILLLTQWFDPEPTFKGLTFARALAARGHSVEVLTGFPNYPGGRVYDGYRMRWRQLEILDGIRVVRVPLYPSHDGSVLRRALNYSSFAVSAAVLGTWSVSRPDVAYVYHPPGTIGLPALALRALRGIPFVYDIQDLWPDSVAASGMMSSLRMNRLLDAWCHLVYRGSNQLVVLSPGFKRTLVARGVPEHKVHVIYNWCDESSLVSSIADPTMARELGLAGRFNVVFAGTMGKVQGLDAVLRAAQRLLHQEPKVQFVFVGGGVEVEHLRQTSTTLGLDNVKFLPRRPVIEIGGVLALADVLLVHLKDDPLFRITIPSKTQAYMAVGRPILMAMRGDAADLVREAGCGLCCEPEDPESIATTVRRLVAMDHCALAAMGENGRKFYAKRLSLHVGVGHFDGVFRAAAGV